jgi:signal transduction histidine kinase
MEKEIKEDKWRIFLIIILLMGGTVGVIFFIARRSIERPISALLHGIKSMAQGNLDAKIALKRNDELGEVAHAFNNMTISLKENRERLAHEAEIRLELERNFRHSEKMATIGQLASELAHEIGTPLNIIAGRAGLTKENLAETEAAQKNLDIILTQTGRITITVQQLLSFARKKRTEQKRIDVNQLLETTLDLLDYQIHKQGVSVKRRLEANLPFLGADPDLLQQVFVNLFLNSLQSMPEGGTLQITSSKRRLLKEGLQYGEQDYVEISVEDTGVGMDEDTMGNVFTPFFTTKEKGTGLGLTITHRIVQERGGWIDVKSNVGKGSVFTVYLPALREDGNLGRK